MIDTQSRLVLQERAIKALTDRIAEESYLSIAKVMKRLDLSRSTIEALPIEVLPFVDNSPTPGRQLRRYHPADVLAYDGRMRGWQRAKQQGQGEAYLAKLRAELEARDDLAHTLAVRGAA